MGRRTDGIYSQKKKKEIQNRIQGEMKKIDTPFLTSTKQ
jgi:hypothetical protein